MKKIFLLVCPLILLLFIAACKKDNLSDSIQGVWQLNKVTGGIYLVDTPPPSKHTLRISGNQYEFIFNGQTIKSGQFKIVDESPRIQASCGTPTDGFKHRIIYDNDNTNFIYIKISGNRLSFVSGCFANDAGSLQEYIRQ
jgi:hypothetical protein